MGMKRLLPWILVVLILTVIFGTVYSVTSKLQLSNANWPQIQMAQDAAASLDKDNNPEFLTGDHVDINKSLKPFIIVYDKNGKAVSGSGFSNGKLPKVDKHVLEDSKDKDYSAVTWKPGKDTTIAAIIVAAKDYYVLSGRSLEEIEKNENSTLLAIGLGWLLSVVLLGGLFVASAQSEEI